MFYGVTWSETGMFHEVTWSEKGMCSTVLWSYLKWDRDVFYGVTWSETGMCSMKLPGERQGCVPWSYLEWDKDVLYNVSWNDTGMCSISYIKEISKATHTVNSSCPYCNYRCYKGYWAKCNQCFCMDSAEQMTQKGSIFSSPLDNIMLSWISTTEENETNRNNISAVVVKKRQSKCWRCKNLSWIPPHIEVTRSPGY